MKLFGRKGDKPKQTNIERMISEAESMILELPEAEQRAALEAVSTLFGCLGPLFKLPQGVWSRLWKVLVLVVAKTTTGAKIEDLLAEVARGAPRLTERGKAYPNLIAMRSKLDEAL